MELTHDIKTQQAIYALLVEKMRQDVGDRRDWTVKMETCNFLGSRSFTNFTILIASENGSFTEGNRFYLNDEIDDITRLDGFTAKIDEYIKTSYING